MQHSRLAILLHSSKTMRQEAATSPLRTPVFVREATELTTFLRTLPPEAIEKAMHVSSSLALKTQKTIDAWTPGPHNQTLAIDSFIGDIYSGLRAQELTAADRDYADTVLYILSGLYGVLRPYDGISPYRLEMGYSFAGAGFGNLYQFWGPKIAQQLPEAGIIVNTSSVEYTKAVLPFVDAERVITPQFLTVNQKTGVPGFTAVHAKIARGAFARWLITSRITDPARFNEFSDLGYTFDAALSSPQTPTFVCQHFGGIGLSIRLT